MVFGRSWLNPRTFGIASVLTGLAGLAFILFGGSALTTVGVIMVIASTVSLFFAVGAYIQGRRGRSPE